VNVGISVSRVGGSAQIKAMKKWPAGCASTSRSTASSRRSRSSAPTSTRPRSAARARRAHGRDPQAAAVRADAVEEQVMIIYAVTNGLIDDVPTNRVRAFELGFRVHAYAEAGDRRGDPLEGRAGRRTRRRR
jgi:F-type H+/Na+-transporting ATPase subunit alpha